MKHTLTFLVLLALILSIGYYSAGFSEMTLKNNENKSIKLSREESESNAVFFSGSESGFDPMKLIQPYDQPENSRPDNIKADISAAMIAVLSRYSPKNEYVEGKELPINEAMMASMNGYIYTRGYTYINPYGEERVLDCIITSSNYDIIYVRFRSAHENEPDSIQAKNALDKFSSFSEDLIENTNTIEETLSRIASELFSDDYVFDENSYLDYSFNTVYSGYDTVYELFSSLYSKLEGIKQSSNPMTRFVVSSCIFMMANIIIEDEQDEDYKIISDMIYPSGGSRVADFISAINANAEREYTLLGDSIFETMNYRHKKLITIYSISDECIEGFYAYEL